MFWLGITWLHWLESTTIEFRDNEQATKQAFRDNSVCHSMAYHHDYFEYKWNAKDKVKLMGN